MAVVFSRLLGIDLPAALECDDSGKNPAFEITFDADGVIPFPQVILHAQGRHPIIKGEGAAPTGHCRTVVEKTTSFKIDAV